ncbi:MAG: aminotransferase class I/II-fold pyridoxal phosphate-dependent enzyme, partial [Candidatus Bathyarchaeia archaeon]
MASRRSLDWLKEKVESMRSFGGSLLGYVGLPPEAKGNVVKLDSNENFFVDAGFLRRVFVEALDDVDLRLYNPDVMASLKEALGKYVGVPGGCVCVGSGAEHLIDFIAQSFLGAGDSVVSFVPSFFMYRKRVSLRGGRVIEVPLKSDLSLDVDGALAKCTPKTKLVFVCSPNNPTGNEFSWDEIEALADGCSALVVIDETYAEFGGGSICSKAAEKENVVVVKTFSKAFGLAGLRFGYLVANEGLASGFSEVIPYTVGTVVARFVERLLESRDVMEDWVNEVKKERDRLIGELRSIRGVKVFNSRANFVTFRTEIDADRVYKGLLKSGVAVRNLG